MIGMNYLKAAALLLASVCLSTVAIAQQFNTIPDHSVIGRIGTGSGSGPSQAIPWTALITQMGAVPTSRRVNTTSPLLGGGSLAADLTLAIANQSANTVLAGPTTGSAVAPGFRALVGSDLPAPGASSLGGVQSLTCSSHNWFNTLSTGGALGCTQPSFSDLSSSLACSQTPALTGDVTTTAGTCGTTIAANAVTNAKMAAMADGTIKSNISGGSAVPSDNTITAVLDKLFGTTQGSVVYRGASTWSVLTPGTSGQLLSSGGAAANPSWITASGTGTVTSVVCGTGLSGGTITASGTCAVNLSALTNSIAADVGLSNTSSFFDGPSVAQGTSGTWWASGTVVVSDTAGGANYACKLWDGTTVISSAYFGTTSGQKLPVALSGYISNPAGNIRISCKDASSTNGWIYANASAAGKDSTISVHRIQ